MVGTQSSPPRKNKKLKLCVDEKKICTALLNTNHFLRRVVLEPLEQNSPLRNGKGYYS